MPYQGFADGLYFGVQWSVAKRLYHYGILIVGSRPRLWQLGAMPMAVHQSPPGVRFEPLYATGPWLIQHKIEDEATAIARLNIALNNPDYRVLWHNCEHFARWVAFGTWESKQLHTAGWVVGVTAVAIVALNNDTVEEDD